LANGANCPVIILGPELNDPQHPVDHLRLLDLCIDGNRKNQKTEHWRKAVDGSEINNDGVEVWNVNDAKVEHVVCCRCRSGGLVTAEVRRLDIDDFAAFDNQYDGLACYQTENSEFDGLRLHDNLAAGISLDLDFDHNFIRDAVLAGNDLGVFMRDSCSNSFEGLTISKSRHDGVFMAQHVVHTSKGWHRCPHTECVGNHFESLTVDNCGGRGFQINDASCIKNVVLGAHFLHNILGGLCEPATHPAVQVMAGR
jgi:Right handed beta helix region